MRDILAMIGFSFLCSILLLPMTGAMAAGGTVRKVDCDKGETIQNKIDEAKAGDVIVVSGTCNENLVIRKEMHDITLDGQGMATINRPDSTRNTITIRGKGITIRGMNITGGRNGISIRQDAEASINGNHINRTGRWAIVVTNNSSARIMNNTIQDNPRGGILIRAHSRAQIGVSGPPGERVFFPNTIIHNGGRAGIQVSRFSEAFIAGNVIRNNRQGIRVVNHSQAHIGLPDSPVTLGANKIEGNDTGIIIKRSSFARIVGNLISNARDSSGIQVQNDSHALIARNIISNNAGHGIKVSGNSSVTLGNDRGNSTFDEPNKTTVNNGRFGIWCKGGGYVKGRLGTLNGNSGTRSFEEGCTEKLLQGQKPEFNDSMVSAIKRSPKSKIEDPQSELAKRGTLHKVNCQEGESVQNKLDEAKAGDVIVVSGSCNENLVMRKELHDITLDGEGLATINGPDPSRDTIRVRGKGVTIRGFIITGGRRGIHVYQGGRASIDSNIIERTGGDAIVIGRDSSANILGNTIQNNPGRGIGISGSSTARIGVSGSGGEGKFFPNTIIQNGGRGIDVRRTSEALIAGNTISHNSDLAIYVSDNSRVHIGLPDDKVNLGANTIEGNGGGGILLRLSSFARIIGNTISNNEGMDGIGVRDASHAEIARNIIDNNARHGISVTQNSSVTLGKDKITTFFDEPNNTSVDNGGFGIRCLGGEYVKGRIGTVRGKDGIKSFGDGCIDELIR